MYLRGRLFVVEVAGEGKLWYNSEFAALSPHLMHACLVQPVGFQSLIKGRTTAVRLRIVEFINEILIGLCMAYMSRTSFKFVWERYQFNHSQRQAIIHFLMVNDLIADYSRGFSFSEDIYKLTELHPSKTLFESVKFSQIPDVKTEIRNGNDKTLRDDSDSRLLKKYTKELQDALNVPLVKMKRIYSGKYKRGGRIYSKYQSMSALDRMECIKIDGDSVVEMDYRNNHLNILLTCLGRNDKTDEDLYSIMDDFMIERKIVKKAISAILNAERPLVALTSNRGSFAWQEDLAREFMNRFYFNFPELKPLKTGAELGLELQRIEGDVMMGIIEKCLQSHAIILPVHDSVICKRHEQAAVHEIMKTVWSEKVNMNSVTVKEFCND